MYSLVISNHFSSVSSEPCSESTHPPPKHQHHNLAISEHMYEKPEISYATRINLSNYNKYEENIIFQFCLTDKPLKKEIKYRGNKNWVENKNTKYTYKR